MTDADLSIRLAEILTPLLGQVEIQDLTRLTGGASRETWSFDAVDSAELRTGLILQREQGGTALGIPFPQEDRLLRAAAHAGVPVAEIVIDSVGCAGLKSAPDGALNSAPDTASDARITRRVEGEALAPKIVRSEEFAAARAVLPGQLARALAAIHSIPPDEFTDLGGEGPVEQIRAGLELLGVDSPAFELALRWLDLNRPRQERRTVVHGDFRIGNMLVDRSGLQAVLDWELAHIGDPVEDLGWLCVRAWRFGGPGVVGGIGDLDELIAAYREASGFKVDEDHVRWWIIAGTLRWGLICAVQASRHLEGHVRSVELATIGRRIAENEHDLLDLLGVPPHPSERPLPVVDHGHPSATELVRAVRDHLGEVVMPKLERGDAFAVRVASNALAMVERELAATPSPEVSLDEAAIVTRIRAGGVLDDDDLADIRAAVTARVAVANPKWLSLS
ncbi:MAG: phosphotransferase [Microthrixaceae bacterium]